MTLMTLGTPWWVRLAVRVGLLREEAVPAAFTCGGAGFGAIAAWLELEQICKPDQIRYCWLHGALLKPVDWGRA